MAATVTTPTFTFRTGYGEYVTLPTAANTAYNPGDLIWNNSGVAATAATYTWSTNLANTQAQFRALFVGVCQDQKLATDASTSSILICTRGFFNYPCGSLVSAANIGTLVNAAQDGSNTNLASQVLASVTGNAQAIGKVSTNAVSGSVNLDAFLQGYAIYGGIGA